MSTAFDPRQTPICFIFNPHSGHNRRNPYLLERTRGFIKEHQLDATVELTERPRHATDLARAAVDRGCGLIVAIGGDGTLNEVAAALVGAPAALGLIPCGSGNGLGRHLGVPDPGRGAYATLLRGRIREIDTGSVNGIPFFNAMGLGFDAEISSRFNQLTRRGLAAYVRTGLRAWASYQPNHYVIRNGQSELSTDAFIVAVANSDQYGNDCFIAPGAQVDDGLLNLTVLKRVNTFTALPLAFRLFRGSIDRSRHVARLTGSHFRIERPAAGPIHTDGEVHATGTVVDIEVRPRSLRILVPSTP
ncbi:diacylglycerol/lipid kinase family protein [Synoicihabitans lomoniglobus]|uniref:Diacylglycerol kinase family lipid kinase n=1 Tax=Synoicihabitans lomoniglobus TaxID=2909285 RepID=A0AAF0CQC6_9BACT|nr:diacylglycerol kinase family lipid kinase [Opitutaceae bacterium LMO-M01]WED66131.1 diacylglycerol kinase family lipid kinase [Opitutaceae bacterium LMO-M01]